MPNNPITEAALAELDRLRAVVNDMGDLMADVRKQRDAALALTPASAGNRMKAEAYLELCDGLLFFVDADVKQMLRMEAARLTAEAEKEAANGR